MCVRHIRIRYCLTSYYGVVGAVSGIVIATLVLSGYFVYSFIRL